MTTSLTRIARVGATAAALALAAAAVPVAAVPAVAAGPSVQSQLALVRNATAQYHSLANAEADLFEPLLDCFDDPTLGGMGQHYVLPGRMDTTVSLTEPEVLVYEPTDEGYKLGAVEYLVPDATGALPTPTLLDHDFTYVPDLQVWELHAWIWDTNPVDMFTEYNPEAPMCPPAT